MRTWARWAATGALLLAAALVATVPARPARAADAKVGFQVTVLAATSKPGGIDPKAERFHAILGRKVRYESLRLLRSDRQRLGVGDIGSVSLPTGTRFRFRPLDIGGKGVLVAVDMGRAAQGDFRIPKGKPLMLGGEPYQGGELWVVLEAED